MLLSLALPLVHAINQSRLLVRQQVITCDCLTIYLSHSLCRSLLDVLLPACQLTLPIATYLQSHSFSVSLTRCLTHSLSQSLAVSLTRCLTHSLSHSLAACNPLSHSLPAAGTRTPGLQHSPASFGNGPIDADFDSSVYDVSAATEVCPFHCCHFMLTFIPPHYVTSPVSNLAADVSCENRILTFGAAATCSTSSLSELNPLCVSPRPLLQLLLLHHPNQQRPAGCKFTDQMIATTPRPQPRRASLGSLGTLVQG